MASNAIVQRPLSIPRGADAGPPRLGRRALQLGAARLAAGAAGAAAVAACGPLPGGDGAPKALDAPVTLEAWTPWTDAGSWEQAATAYKSVQPNITIQWTPIGFGPYLDKVTTATASGTPPDLPYLDNQHQGFFGKNNLLLDQGPLGKKDRGFRADMIEPKALALYTYDGAVLGYPVSLTTGQVFFNRAIFAAGGRPMPDQLYKEGRWTWATMTEAAVALTRRDAAGTIQTLGLSHMSIWRLALNSNGTDMYDNFARPKKSRLDEPPAIAAIEWVHDVAHKHRAAWKQPEAKDLGGDANKAMNAGKLAMHVSWGVPHALNARYDQVWDKMGWVPFPKGPAPGGKPVADLTTEAQGIMQASKQHDTAWLYCRWYQKDWQRTRLEDKANPRVASRTDLLDLSKASLPPPQDMWFEMAKNGVARPVFPDLSAVTRDIINPALNPVWAGEAAPRAAALAVAKQLNDFFAATPQ
ncbi:MAG: extracellular solute-binding protein [Chloroflexi bacterium]|nr:extracellular solute-binding protein [Chloroflexota bacterium]